MEKSIKLFIAGLLCTTLSAAQVTDSIQQYGRGISYKLKEATTAGAVVTSKALEHRTSTVSSNALFGMIPGLQVMQNAGNEWDNGATFFVRGAGTSSSTEPLILVDGFERNIDHLAVRDIESVTVLKDAASLALYGIRGANGVIYIKTKRGHIGKPVITFDYEFKMGTPIYKPEFVDGYTYAQAINEGMKNDGLAPLYSQRELDAFRNQTYPEFYPNVNW
ncbi:secreted protein containing TonB-dependent receptor, plug domain protein, partial [gut metagenome]